MVLSFPTLVAFGLLVLSVRLIWLGATVFMVEAWLWRDRLDEARVGLDPPTVVCDPSASRQKLFWTFLRERLMLLLSPVTALWRMLTSPYTPGEKRCLIGLFVLQVLVTLALVFPSRVLGLPAQVLVTLYRRCWWPLQAHRDEIATSSPQVKAAVLRHVQATVYRDWDGGENALMYAQQCSATLEEARIECDGRGERKPC
jgi:hypothetical protein